MKKTIKYISFLLLCFTSFYILSFTISASESLAGATAWFFKKTKDHTQPSLDPRLSFIEKYNCVYVDKTHTHQNEDKVLYLTFDAGYENGNVEKILDAMKNEGVCGSFFILENLIVRNTDLVKRMADEGHLVCNHTMKHKDMSRVTQKETFKKELEALETLYEDKTGYKMAKIYRPPEGRFSELNLKHATELGYKTVFWSFAYADWDNKNQLSAENAKEKILANTHNGSIILLHPTSDTNAQIIGEIIREWKAQGYRFETLDKLP